MSDNYNNPAGDSENQERIFLESDKRDQEKLGTGLTILAFCIPLAGAILYFTNRRDSPKKAQTACYAALAGIALGLIMRVATMAVSGGY